MPDRASDHDTDERSASAVAVSARRGGRPRLDRRPFSGDPSGEILAAAARLFQQRGIESTTMSRLATEVGLKQSSLYYYFPNRDAVVAALVAQANVVPLQLIDGILAEGASAAASWRRAAP